jgi:D-sedoheptulose 7-phosphate isomerase
MATITARRLPIAEILRYLILVALGILFILPFIWMVSTSFKETGQAYRFPPEFIPQPLTVKNYLNLWGGPIPFDTVASRYLERLADLMASMDLAALHRVTERLRVARDAGATVFIAGNGGSAATATHWANDLNKAATRSGRRPFRCISLTDSTSWVTALANDEGYERVFAGQLENLARPGDVLAMISASGKSPNLLRAVEVAAPRGVVTVALLGFDGGSLREMVDEYLLVATPPGEYGLVETAHTIAADVVTTYFIEDRDPPG